MASGPFAVAVTSPKIFKDNTTFSPSAFIGPFDWRESHAVNAIVGGFC